MDREGVGRAARPSAAIIDSRSVKTTEADDPGGYYYASKMINGGKRHALVNMDGRALLLEPRPHSGLSRRRPPPRASRILYPFIARVFADSGDNHEWVANATNIVIEVVRKIADQVGFVVLPRRWVANRRTISPAWPISNSRRSSSGRPEVAGFAGWRPSSATERVDLSRAISNQ